MGLAATMASGLVSVFGTDAKLVNVGNAASRGIIAAQLSRAGFTAPTDIIEREKGYAIAANGEEDLSFLTHSSEFLMIEDAYYKIHASCGHTHCALDALMTIMQNTKFTHKDIKKIRVGVYRKAAELTGALDTSSESKARFSMPYCIAACIVLGQVGLDAFTKDSLNDMRILELAKKVTVVNDRECDIGYPACRTETIRIELNNGSILTGKIDLPNGHPPAEFLENKYMSLAVRSVRKDQADRIKDFILNCKKEQKFENLGNLIRSEVYYG
jgi:2-methylcitrate dehydratase PrpD